MPAASRTSAPTSKQDEQRRVSSLAPYVPRLAAEWDLDHAGKRWFPLDASTCFLDVTGFTTISERLSAIGRLGAEQLSDLLDHVFSRLLTVAYEKGGTLLKFGGDALLLAFARDDHPRLAYEAAVEMRRALADASASTDVGRVALRASMGVHTGTLQLYRVGTTSRELLVAGPDCSTTLLLERSASSGEILVSDALAAHLAPSAVARTPLGLRVRTRRVGPDGPGILRARAVPTSEVEAWIPAPLRGRLVDRPGESEHRLASIAFVRVSGVDALFEREGGDVVAFALDEIVSAAQRVADDHGVTVLSSDADVDGVKLILAAGVPVTQEDDEGRLLKAARALADERFGLAIHLGVNRGAVFAGDIGTAYRRTFTVIGDAVNVAARLAGAAPPGAVFASAGVLERSRTTFEAIELGALDVKGRRDQVPAWHVGAPIGVRHRATSSLPFLGRDAELGSLLDAVSTARSGTGGVALVEGDRGAGKTRLVVELIERAAADRVIHVQGESFATGVPYHAFRSGLRALLGVTAEDRELAGRQLEDAVRGASPSLFPLVQLLAPIVDADLEPTPETMTIAERFVAARTVDVLTGVLDATQVGTLLLVIEDAHWFDRASTELAAGLAKASRERPWLVCVTRRPMELGFVPQSPTWRIELPPLPDEAVAALIDAGTAAAPLRPQQRDAMVSKAGGNPLFVEELLHVLLEGSSDAIPDSLDAIAMREIDALPSDARRVLLVASTLGREVDRALLGELVGDVAIELALDALADLLIDDGGPGLRFRHALLQEAAYASMSFRLRRDLHRRAGLAIESARAGYADAAALLSLHFFEAQDAERTWRYAQMAAESAKKAHAPGEVRTHLERAVDAARRLGSVQDGLVAALLEEAAEAAIVTGDYEDADATFRRATAAWRDDPVARARIAERRAYLRTEYQGRLAAAIRQVHAGVALLDAAGAEPRATTRVRAALLAREADVRARQGRLTEAVELARTAADAAELADDRRSLALALSLLDQALAEGGRADEATHLPRALELYEELGALDLAAMTLGNLGSVAYWRWEWEAAASYYGDAVTTATAAGDLATAAVAEVNLGELRVDQGRAEEAVALLAPALRTLTSFGFVAGAASARLHLGRATALAGDPAEGARLLRETLEQLEATGIGLLALDARAKLVEVLVLAGDHAAARTVLAEARRAERALGTSAFATLLDRVEAVLLVAEDDERAIAHVRDATARARDLGATYDLCVLLSLAEGLGDGGGAEAADIARGLGVVTIPSLASR